MNSVEAVVVKGPDRLLAKGNGVQGILMRGKSMDWAIRDKVQYSSASHGVTNNEGQWTTCCIIHAAGSRLLVLLVSGTAGTDDSGCRDEFFFLEPPFP